MYRRLTIDSTEVDLPQSGLSYSLVYEVGGDGFVSGAYSKRSIDLPSTLTNDTLFSDWYAAGTANELTAPILKDFVFEDGGLTIMTGKAELQSAPLLSDRYGFKAKSYKVDLYGNNADWTLQLKDLYLRDLPIPSALYDLPTVMSGWTATYDSGDYFGFTLIKWKEWNITGQVGIDEFTPFLFIRSLIDYAFDTIGYTINSNFLDSDVFKRLILVCPPIERYPEEYSQDYLNVDLEEPGTTAEYFDLLPPFFTTPYLFPNITQPSLNAPYNSSTGFYVVPFTGYYEISINVNITSTGTHRSWFGAAINSNTNALVNNSIIFFGDLFGPYSGNASGSSVSDVVYLQAGDTISLAIANSEVPPGQNVTSWSFSMNIRGEAENAFGSILAFKYLVKNWKFIDMLKGLQQMFNLRFEANPQAQTITIEPADDYLYRQYNAPTNVTEELRQGFYTDTTNDTRQQLDLLREAEIFNVSDVPQVTIFDYKTDGDSEEFKQENEPIGIYAAQYTLPADRFNDTTETKENTFFAKTVHTIDGEIQGTTATTMLQVPLIYPQNYELDPTATEADYDVEPRILYFAGYRGIPTDSLVKYAFTGGVELSPPLSFMVNYNTELDFSLGFANEQINGNKATGLFEAFWMHEYARKRIGKRLECGYFWDLLTINALTFRDKILLNGDMFILDKIDGYNAQKDSSTKTVLTLDRYPETADENATETAGIIGIINAI